MTKFSASFITLAGRISLVLGAVAIATAVLRADAPEAALAGTMPEDYFPALKTFIDAALKQSPQMISKAIDIDIANAQKLYSGIAPMLPSAGATLQYGKQVSAASSSSGSAPSSNSGLFYDVSAHQPVFQWGQLKNQLDQQKIAVALSQRNYATVYLQFAGMLRQRYLALVTDKLALRNARYLHKLRQKTLEATQAQFKAGALSPGYMAAPELDEADASLGVDQAEQTYLFARRQFARLLGRPDLADPDIPDAVPAPKFSASAANELLAEVMRTGARYTADAQIALLNIRNSALQYDYWKVNLLPRVSLQADANQQSQTTVQGATATDGAKVTQNSVSNESYYVVANWNIFDGLATHGHKEEALLRRRQAERDLKIKVDTTLDSAQNSERLVELAWRALELATRRDGLAQAGLKQAKDDLASHVGNLESVEESQLAAFNSEVGLAMTRANFISTWTDYVSLVGNDPAMNNLPARYVRPIQ